MKRLKLYMPKTLFMLAILSVAVSVVWRITHNVGWLCNWSTELWCRQQNRLANLAGNIVYPSGWWGVNCVIDGKQFIIKIAKSNTQQPTLVASGKD